MSLEADQALARQFFAALDANRLDALDDLIAPGYRFHAPGSPVLTWEQHKQFHAALSAGLTRLEHTIDDQFGAADRVATRLTARGIHAGVLFKVLPTGKQITVPALTVHRFEAGKIAEYWFSYDQLGLLQQLGVTGSPVQAA